jgi:hypothetical protein
MASYFNFESQRATLQPIIGSMVIGYESMTALVMCANEDVRVILNDYMSMPPDDLVTTKTQALISKCVQERNEKLDKAKKKKDALEGQIANQPGGATPKQGEMVERLETLIAQYEAAVQIEYVPVLTYKPQVYTVALESVKQIIKKVPRRGVIIGVEPRSISTLFTGDSATNKSFDTQLRKSDFASQYQPEKPWADVLNVIRRWAQETGSEHILRIAIHEYVMSAGDCNTLLERIQNYNEMNRKGRRTFAEENPRFLARIMKTAGYENPTCTITTQTLEIFIQEYFRPNPQSRYWGNDPALRKRVEVMTVSEQIDMRKEVMVYITDSYSREARSQMEEIYHDFLIKPKMELRPVTSERHEYPVKVKLPRTFATGYGPVRGAMQALETPFAKDLKGLFEYKRQNNETAPSVLGSTFNSDGLVKILNYLLGKPATTDAVPIEDVLAKTFVCPDRRRMEMTLSLDTKQFYVYSLVVYYKTAKLITQANCCMRIGDWESKPKKLTFQAGNIARLIMAPSVLASGTHGTSWKDDMDNNFHLSCVNLILRGVLNASDFKLVDYNANNKKLELLKMADLEHVFRYITGGDDGWMAVDPGSYDEIIAAMKAYATMVGIEWTDTKQRKMLLLDELSFDLFLAGEMVNTIDGDQVTYDTVHSENKHTIFYGFVPVCKCKDGKIEDIFPLYDVPKMVSSLWHPSSTPPKYEVDGKIFKMSAQTYKIVRSLGINLVVGMFRPINELIKKVVEDIMGNSVLATPFDIKKMIVGAGLPIGVDVDNLPEMESLRVHSPEEVLYIYGVGEQPAPVQEEESELATIDDEDGATFSTQWADLLGEDEDETPTNLPDVNSKVEENVHKMVEIQDDMKKYFEEKKDEGNQKRIVAALYNPVKSKYFKTFKGLPWYVKYNQLSSADKKTVCGNVLDHYVKSSVAIFKVPYDPAAELFTFFYTHNDDTYKLESDDDAPGYFSLIEELEKRHPEDKGAASIIVTVMYADDGPSARVLVPDYLADMKFVVR